MLFSEMTVSALVSWTVTMISSHSARAACHLCQLHRIAKSKPMTAQGLSCSNLQCTSAAAAAFDLLMDVCSLTLWTPQLWGVLTWDFNVLAKCSWQCLSITCWQTNTLIQENLLLYWHLMSITICHDSYRRPGQLCSSIGIYYHHVEHCSDTV